MKYFKPSLTSKCLREIEALNPKSLFIFPLDEMKQKWAYIAKRFPNGIQRQEIPLLLDQVSQMKIHKNVRDAVYELTPTEFFFKFSEVEGGEKFSLVSKLDLALFTAHNSSSSAERDISQMVRFFASMYFFR